MRFLPKIPFTAFHSVQATKGGFFIRKCLTRAIRIIFPQPQAFTQTDFNMRSSKPNPWGQAPYTPKLCFASMQAPCSRSNFSQANGLRRRRPRKGLFPLSAETHGTSRRDMRKCASYIFLDERPPFRCWEIVALYIFFGLVEHLRRRQNFYDIMSKKRFRHAAALVCKICEKIFTRRRTTCERS